MSAEESAGYFLYHSIGAYPGKGRDTAALLSEFALGFGGLDTGHWDRMLPLRQEFIDRWTSLINAPKGSLTTSESVTTAFSSLMGAVPAEHLRGKRVLIAADCFPSLHFLLKGLEEPLGFTLDTVPIRQGAHWVEEEDFMARWDSEVGLALLTWITSTTSHRSNLDALVAHGRAQGSVIGVDITQGAGLLPFDVTQPAVDFVVSTSLKWLCGTPGAGILQVDPAFLTTCEPTLRGWFSQDNPFNWDLDTFEFAPDIRRFDHGTPGIVPAIASLPALRWHGTQNHAALYAHTLELGETLRQGFAEMGLTCVSPEVPESRGGSIMVRTEKAEGVLTHLTEAGFGLDRRSDVLRFSPGIMTTSDQVESVLAHMKTALSA